jgi:hypothetical protein
VTTETLVSEISSPSGSIDPRQIDRYGIVQANDQEGTLSRLDSFYRLVGAFAFT